MKKLLRLIFALVVLAGSSFAASISNGGFEEGLSGWRPFWGREANTGTVTLDSQTVHNGKKSARIDYKGKEDWSFEPDTRVTVQPGDMFEWEAWVKLASQGGGSVTLCVSTWDSHGKVQEWVYAPHSISEPTDWKRLRTRGADSATNGREWPGHGVDRRFFSRKETGGELRPEEGPSGDSQDQQCGALPRA